MDEVSDERLEGFAASNLDGFANWAIMWSEIRAMAIELKHYRDKPLHCPGCDGDHM